MTGGCSTARAVFEDLSSAGAGKPNRDFHCCCCNHRLLRSYRVGRCAARCSPEQVLQPTDLAKAGSTMMVYAVLPSIFSGAIFTALFYGSLAQMRWDFSTFCCASVRLTFQFLNEHVGKCLQSWVYSIRRASLVHGRNHDHEHASGVAREQKRSSRHENTRGPMRFTAEKLHVPY